MNSLASNAGLSFDSIVQAADLLLSANNGTGGYRTVFAQTVIDGHDETGKADELKDYFILDIRKNADYRAGHIPGALNIPIAEISKPETIRILPQDKPILLVCYTGQSAGLVTGLLLLMGYNAWTLRFGMMAWYDESPVGIWSPLEQQVIKGANYPVVRGNSPI